MNPRHALAAITFLSVAVPFAPALAQDAFPSRPIRVVVPFTAGSGTDVVARMLGESLGPALGTSIGGWRKSSRLNATS